MLKEEEHYYIKSGTFQKRADSHLFQSKKEKKKKDYYMWEGDKHKGS